MSNLVLDASAGTELLLDTLIGRSIEAKLPKAREWWVPEHYYLEVAGVLRRLEARGLIATARASSACSKLATAQLPRVQVRPLLAAAWKRRSHLTVGDAPYVVLAEELHGALVTADLNLARSPGLSVRTITR